MDAIGSVMRTQGRGLGAAAATIAALALAFALPAQADAQWQQAERIRADLFKAQTSLLLDGGAGATRSVEHARRALAGELERGLRIRSPGSCARSRHSWLLRARPPRGATRSRSPPRGAASSRR